MIRIGLIFFIVIFNIEKVSSQTFDERTTFVKYLLAKELFRDAVLESKKINNEFKKSKSQQDSINYFIGKSYFYENHDSSLFYLGKVNRTGSVFFTSSQVMSSYLYLFQKQYSRGFEQMNFLRSKIEEEQCLINLMKYSAKTLQREKEDSISEDCSNLFYEYLVLNEKQFELTQIKKKSPFLAGAFSAIIPGMGKIYAGKKKEGISALFIVSLLGYQTYEGYRIGGVKDARFIVFGSLFSVFYIGNIWGSALSVQIVKHERYDEIHNNIIATLRIPVDKLFKSN